MFQFVTEVGQVFDNVSLAGQIVPREGEDDLPRSLLLAVRAEQARVVPYQPVLLGKVEKVDQLEELFQNELVERVLMALAVAVGHRRVGIVRQNVRVGEQAGHQEAGEAHQVGVGAEGEQLTVDGLQSDSQPQRIIGEDEEEQ